MTGWRLGWVLALVAVLAVPPVPAQAAYLGRNGRLAFTIARSDGNFDIYRVRPNGSDLDRLTHATSFDACPSYSNTGRHIAFCSDRSGTFEIWTMNADGSKERQLTHMDGFATFPDFSPRGTKVAFGAIKKGDPEGREDIYVVGADGSRLRRLTSRGTNAFPVWAPNGRRILYVCGPEGHAQICVMRRDGSDKRRLTRDDLNKEQVPDWRPDGWKIAYAAGGDIWVMGARGRGKHRVTTTADDDFGPTWSPDGKKIAFVRATETTRYVMIMNADGSNARVVRATPGRTQLIPAWQPRPAR